MDYVKDMQLQNSKDTSVDEFADLLSPDEAVLLIPEKFKISRSTLMRLAKTGKIRSYHDVLRLLEPQGGTESVAPMDRPSSGLKSD